MRTSKNLQPPSINRDNSLQSESVISFKRIDSAVTNCISVDAEEKTFTNCERSGRVSKDGENRGKMRFLMVRVQELEKK